MSCARLTCSFAVLGLLLSAGCTTTTVTKNPGPHDKGIRFYRPKPYLMIKPLHYDADKGDIVSIGIEYLPDYSEEYSIRVRAGLGANTTNVKLDNGWMLSNMDQTLDSKFADNLTAISGLLGALPGLTSEKGATKMRSSAGPSFECAARNVPYGLYEPVFGRDAQCCKNLYGWRYVGFIPFTPCPVASAGGTDCLPCDVLDLYGLVSQGGVMVFMPLRELGNAQVSFPEAEHVPTPAPTTPLTKPLVRQIAAPILALGFGSTASLGDLGEVAGSSAIQIPVKVAPQIWNDKQQEILSMQSAIQNALRTIVKDDALIVTLTHQM